MLYCMINKLSITKLSICKGGRCDSTLALKRPT